MALAEDIADVGRMLDAYFAGYPATDVAKVPPEDAGVPAEMWGGPVDDDGWVRWRMLVSSLSEDDVSAVERDFGVAFPPLFKAFLLARFQLFSQVGSRKHKQTIQMTTTPSDGPLEPLREELGAWRALIPSGFIPFAEWGDGYGPLCFDAEGRAADGDCPIGWLDHEILHSLGPEACGERASLLPHWRPLYGAFRELLQDAFT